ncbi:ribosome production factor 1-like [Crassostrea angulata]|uniref:ribosome production factor 1-like n=1 Tax=Magallana angulata TaxID=2784310 RepID=UPI0022B0EE0D|nr:ribosome production factor 1-like [Crassostrea angulata]
MAPKKMKVENVEEENQKEVTEDVQTIPKPNISRIKNKILRNEMYKKLRVEKRKAKLKEKQRKKKEAESMGEEAPPKQVPKTIESMRVKDETMVNTEDTEVMLDEAQDELATYFNRETSPQILITTCDRPCLRTNKFCKELKLTIPNSEIKYRRGLDLKKIIPQAKERGYTDIIIVNEDRKEPNGLVITHLPEGPTLHFKLSSVRLTTEIKRVGEMSKHKPELILNNFGTRLGHSVGRVFASLFPHDPQFHGRRVVTFHNQRDFIFFRHHRYVFRNNKRVGLKELGPRFTLKLRSLQKGTFDSKYGEYEWVHKRKEMETSRRKFSL